jgi:hypothetical protein
MAVIQASSLWVDTSCSPCSNDAWHVGMVVPLMPAQHFRAGVRGMGRDRSQAVTGEYEQSRENAMTESGSSSVSGVISGQPVVDFSHLTSAADLAAVSRIESVAAVIVPESLAGAYAAIPTEGVATTVFVPESANVRVHVGSLMVGGDGLGTAEDVLVIIGMLVITSPVTGAVPRRISVVGSILAPRGSESALGKAVGGGTGTVTYYRYTEGQDIKVLTGQVKLSGAMLANPAGTPDDLLVAAGQVIVTGQVSTVGYAHVFVVGQLFAPAASREVLEPRTEAIGQTAWYRSDDPRLILDSMQLGPDFFRLLDHPVSLMVLGNLSFSPGVTAAMVHEKVADILALGDITAPAELVPVLQVLAADAAGSIRADDGSGS